MKNQNLHRLLKRQIKKAEFSDAELERYSQFFEAVNVAYKDFDSDISHVENILERSSNELFKANKTLKRQIHNVESKLDSIVNNIEGVIFKTDLEGNFKYLNKAWEELIGIPIDKALNTNYRDLLTGINRREKLRLNQFFKSQHKDYTTIFKYFKPSGEKTWIQLRFILNYDEYGNPSGTIGTMTDVTQLKETEIELNNANKTKDEFLSTMSHEIRTPLNAVIGMSEILLMEKFLPEQLENLQVLKYSSEHLLALINDLLDLNKLKSEEMSLDEDDFNMAELVQNIQLHFKLSASSKKLFFNTRIDKDIPFMLRGDSLKLSQVIKNLLSNAFKFTDKGGVTLNVISLKNVDGHQTIRFEVEDTGIGVSYDKQKDIFKSFVQANKDTSKLYGGSGLGLYISKQLLKIQDSNLHLQSEIGKGSKFWFDIEFKPSTKQVAFNTNYIAKTEKINLKVLVAEDNNLNALLLRKLFKKWDVTYKIAKNGSELLKVYKDEDFDLILMDLQMPILDGYETTRAIRKLDDESKSMIPIIALTAFMKSEIQDKTERYKMNGYLSKPFNVNELHNLLSFYCKKQQQVV
ncbi:PAS domain-containing hybrid sensor histidine kinase/response regulator [Winogradskyella aurantiaca]|uniref:PAS domain-containing hybrid sensor histidine kinase/response regulator n=1 Tax=Winogradskyella aurantiaca TaxID=2219558 RepID=UPI000E1D14B2|nr:PAS domain-containing hybrid sensor histidine kinase/response regulator [Winogradskyella aurantiaca]